MITAPHNTKAKAPACLTSSSEYQVVFETEGETLRIVSTLLSVISALRELGYKGKDGRLSEGHGTVYRISSELESTGPVLIVEYNERVVFRTREEDLVVRYLIVAIRRFIFQNKRGDLFVHAGAVSLENLGIMLPGESRSGKSTLTLALLLNGCRYLSDELAILEQGTLRLMPTGTHVSLRRETYALFPQFHEARPYRWRQGTDEKAFLPLEIVGEDLLSAWCALGLIVFPKFRQGSEFCWQHLERGTAALKLLRLCHNLRWRTKERIDLAIEAVQKVDCFTLTFEDVHQAADWIVQEARTRLCGKIETWT